MDDQPERGQILRLAEEETHGRVTRSQQERKIDRRDYGEGPLRRYSWL